MTEQVGRRRIGRLGGAVLVLAAVLFGAVAGLAVGVATPAHAVVAGSDTRLWVEPGRSYDQVGVPGVVSLHKDTPRTVAGEPLGVRALLDLDASELVDARGQLTPDVLPAYIQAYSDPNQLVADLQHALVVHLVASTVVGAVLGLLVMALLLGYRSWREAYDRRTGTVQQRAAALAYRRPERRASGRVLAVLLLVVVVGAIPSAARRQPVPRVVAGEPVFVGTPLQGVRVDGLLRPALLAAESYIQTYFSRTDAYYGLLRKALDAKLAPDPVLIPGGDDVTTVGFVTDRHCNTGMDRVIIALLQHFGVRTLVSAGDDAFSGTFAFESACTANLAERSKAAGITDVFAGGNHDSPQTIRAQRQQGIRTLTGRTVRVNGLTFLGSPDPRTSRYGVGIRPSTTSAQDAVIAAQGAAVARTACATQAPIVAVLHDPRAGLAALTGGCSHVTVALDGHTHTQAGPNPVALADSEIGYQFTGGSSGGAPGGGETDRSLASSVTVGPLNHPAFVELVTIQPSTGRLLALTDFTFAPDRTIAITQQTF